MTHPNNLPLYQCFKQVHAAKVSRIQTTVVNNDGQMHTLYFVDRAIGNVNISDAVYKKHQPKDGWYYVVYAGYESFSPPEAFEAGYFRTNKEGNLHTQIAELMDEVNDADRLSGRLASLLSRIADALYGPAEDDTLHDWSQLPKNVTALRTTADEAAEQLTSAAWAMSTPPDDMPDGLKNLLATRGIQIRDLGERLKTAGRWAYPDVMPQAASTAFLFEFGEPVTFTGWRDNRAHSGWTVDAARKHEDQIVYDLVHEDGSKVTGVNQDDVQRESIEQCEKDSLCSLPKGHAAACETIF